MKMQLTFFLKDKDNSQHLPEGRGQLTLCADAADNPGAAWCCLYMETGECTQASAMHGSPADPRSACPVSEIDDCTMASGSLSYFTATQEGEGVTSILRD